MLDDHSVVESTRRWIAEVVIGLNLCPFAGRVFKNDGIRYVVTGAADLRGLRAALTSELTSLVATPIDQVETSLLIHPHVLHDFLDYNDFVGEAEELVEQLGLEGNIQIASFHPSYRFADTPRDAVENYTNRSPYPMLHLLREESITAVADDAQELLAIPERNIATLRRLGRVKIQAMLRAAADGPNPRL